MTREAHELRTGVRYGRLRVPLLVVLMALVIAVPAFARGPIISKEGTSVSNAPVTASAVWSALMIFYLGTDHAF